jgi:hypothetical protein
VHPCCCCDPNLNEYRKILFLHRFLALEQHTLRKPQSSSSYFLTCTVACRAASSRCRSRPGSSPTAQCSAVNPSPSAAVRAETSSAGVSLQAWSKVEGRVENTRGSAHGLTSSKPAAAVHQQPLRLAPTLGAVPPPRQRFDPSSKPPCSVGKPFSQVLIRACSTSLLAR